MKIKKLFFVSLRKFDLFAEPVSLTFKGSKKISTSSGNFFTILLIALVFLISNSKLESIIYRGTVYIQNLAEITDNPPEINLKNRFAFYSSISGLAAIRGKRYLDFTVQMGKILFLNNGTMIWKTQNINLVECNASHFPTISEERLKKQGIKDWICPDYNNKEYDFSIKGTFGNPDYSYITFNVKSCSNKTNIDNESFCVSDEEFRAMKKAKNKLYIDLLFINNAVDLNDFNKPFKPMFDFSAILIEPNKTFIQNEIYFQNTTISTDPTQSFNAFRRESEYWNENSVIFNGKIDNYLLTDVSSAGNVFASIFLRSDKLIQKYVRTYDCFQDYLQCLGSFYSIFYLIFSIINSYFARPLKAKEIANALYNFTDDKNKNLQRKYNLKNSVLKKLKEFWFLLIGKTKVNGYHYPKIERQTNRDLDVIQILFSLNILNNLKRVLVNDKQRLILDLAGKEIFENSLLNEKKKMLKFTEVFPAFYNKSRLIFTKEKENFFDGIQKSFIDLKKDKNEVSKKICEIIEKNRIIIPNQVNPSSERQNNSTSLKFESNKEEQNK